MQWFPRFGREFSGGLIAALTGLPVLLACALIIAAPLDSAFFAPAIQSAIVTAIGAGLIGSWLSGIPAHISGPRISLSLLMAAWLATIPDLTPANFLALVGASTVLSGAFLVLMGAMRLGSLIHFLPYPVLAGFITAINVSILASQTPLMLAGLLDAFPGRADLPQPVSIIAIGVTCAGTLLLPRLLPRVPGSLAGMVLGAAAFYVAGRLSLPAFAYANESLGGLSLSATAIAVLGMNDLPLTRALIPHAAALAVLGALESLMSATAVQKLTGQPLRANVELVGQGITNILLGLLGGMPSAGTPGRSESTVLAGATTRLAGALMGAITALLMIGGAPFLASLPTAVISGSLVATTLVSLHLWGIAPLARMLRQSLRHAALRGEIVIFALVLAVGLVYGPTNAVGFGAVCAMALFISKSGQTVVRRVADGTQVRSSLQRNNAARAVLDREGGRIRFIEAGGALFFGSADALMQTVRQHLQGASTLIVDIERITDIDSSGANVLCEIARLCGREEIGFRVAGRHVVHAHRAVLAAAGFDAVVGAGRLFDTGDHALEQAENEMLAERGVATDHAAVPPAMAGLFRGLTRTEFDKVAALLAPRRLEAGETLFREGDPVDGLYIIDEGQISIRIEDTSGVPRRIASFAPGTMIGEIAFVEGGNRSAHAVAEETSRLWLLRPDALATLDRADPHIVHAVIANIAREIAARLRGNTIFLKQR